MKYIFLVIGLGVALTACYKHSTEASSPVLQTVFSRSKRICGDSVYEKILFQTDTTYAIGKQKTEAFFTSIGYNEKLLPSGIIQIPVVFNVLYSTAADNVTQAQIQSQLDVLNEDYGAFNSDYALVPGIFQALRSGDILVQFVLDKVVRKKSVLATWNVGNDMKQLVKGGIAPTSPTKKLNIWVCTLGGGVLGFAQFPGGKAVTDGVVIDVHAFGRGGSALSPFDRGRTATHEVGHWLGLHHIWGDSFCGDDLVSDTPSQDAANYGTPTFPKYSLCGKSIIEMTMNFMDYVDDKDMHMFSKGQKLRIQANFVVGGPRYLFAKP